LFGKLYHDQLEVSLETTREFSGQMRTEKYKWEGVERMLKQNAYHLFLPLISPISHELKKYA